MLEKFSANDWSKLGDKFENATALETLDYTSRELSKIGEILFLTAFGAEGCVLMDMLFKLDSKNISVANLDTGYQFKETLKLKDELEKKYQITIDMVQPEFTVLEQDSKYGQDLFNKDPDQCCYMRKLVPLAKLLENKYAWITSIRRDQTEHRASAKAFEWDRKFKLGKINPLIHFTKSDIWKYIHENGVPYNLLLDQGYDSIGCEPCTKPGDDRKGRWVGKDKIECGLHIQDSEQGGEFVI